MTSRAFRTQYTHLPHQYYRHKVNSGHEATVKEQFQACAERLLKNWPAPITGSSWMRKFDIVLFCKKLNFYFIKIIAHFCVSRTQFDVELGKKVRVALDSIVRVNIAYIALVDQVPVQFLL